MADFKMKNYFNKRNIEIKNVVMQVTTIHLTKNNYLKWSTAITMDIVGCDRFIA